jgi:hypothetical protein
MPKHPYYPGTHSCTDDSIAHKIITFISLSRYVRNKTFIKPSFQGSLDESKVNSMIHCYLKNPSNFQYKNRIIVGDLNGKLYIIDGQHRVEMIIELCNKNQEYTRKKVEVVYYPLKNMEEALQLFKEINIDSHKNQFFITTDLFGQMTISGFRDKLKDNYKGIFNNKFKETSRIKCIEEFSNELFKCGFFEHKTIEEAFDELIKLNDVYYNKSYKIYDDDILEQFLYKNEMKSILDYGVCFVTKKNNFIEYVKDQTTKPIHTWKKGKKRITKGLKSKVWYKEFVHTNTGTCPIVHCNNEIIKTAFEAGHVISEINNGPTELSNLRPICKDCNRQMGSQNWNDFDTCKNY